MQALSYRASLQRDFLSVRVDGLEAFDPRCVVIIGSTDELAGDDDMTRAFELYRSSIAPSVTVITYDELFQRTRHLVNVLETTA
jgi:hypothetical protein